MKRLEKKKAGLRGGAAQPPLQFGGQLVWLLDGAIGVAYAGSGRFELVGPVLAVLLSARWHGSLVQAKEFYLTRVLAGHILGRTAAALRAPEDRPSPASGPDTCGMR